MTRLALLTDALLDGGAITSTAYGDSAPILTIQVAGRDVLACCPGLADPRATIRALKDADVTHLWLLEGAATLSPLLEVGDWLIPDDYIDGSRGGPTTFFSEKAGGYTQQVPAFDEASRAALIEGARTVSPRPFRRGVYVNITPSRLETPAEAVFWSRAGGHAAGRLLSPWLTLARELDMRTAVLVTIRRAGGIPGEPPLLADYLPAVSAAAERLYAAP